MNARSVAVRHLHTLSVDFSWIPAMNTGPDTATDTGNDTARTQVISDSTYCKRN
jgi:hypothetical protein